MSDAGFLASLCLSAYTHSCFHCFVVDCVRSWKTNFPSKNFQIETTYDAGWMLKEKKLWRIMLVISLFRPSFGLVSLFIVSAWFVFVFSLSTDERSRKVCRHFSGSLTHVCTSASHSKWSRIHKTLILRKLSNAFPTLRLSNSEQQKMKNGKHRRKFFSTMEERKLSHKTATFWTLNCHDDCVEVVVKGTLTLLVRGMNATRKKITMKRKVCRGELFSFFIYDGRVQFQLQKNMRNMSMNGP